MVEYRSEVFAYLVTAAANMLSWAPQAPGELPARFLDFARLAWAWYAATGQPERAIPALNAWRAAQALAVGDADPLLRAILEYAPAEGIQRRTATDFVRAPSAWVMPARRCPTSVGARPSRTGCASCAPA